MHGAAVVLAGPALPWFKIRGIVCEHAGGVDELAALPWFKIRGIVCANAVLYVTW